MKISVTASTRRSVDAVLVEVLLELAPDVDDVDPLGKVDVVGPASQDREREDVEVRARQVLVLRLEPVQADLGQQEPAEVSVQPPQVGRGLGRLVLLELLGKEFLEEAGIGQIVGFELEAPVLVELVAVEPVGLAAVRMFERRELGVEGRSGTAAQVVEEVAVEEAAIFIPLVVQLDAAGHAAHLAVVDLEIEVAPLVQLSLLVLESDARAQVGIDVVAESPAVASPDRAEREVHQPRAEGEAGNIEERDPAELGDQLVEIDRHRRRTDGSRSSPRTSAVRCRAASRGRPRVIAGRRRSSWSPGRPRPPSSPFGVDPAPRGWQRSCS